MFVLVPFTQVIGKIVGSELGAKLSKNVTDNITQWEAELQEIEATTPASV